MCDASLGSVTRWEDGSLTPSLYHATLLAKALRVSLDLLVFGVHMRDHGAKGRPKSVKVKKKASRRAG